ncbi:MAG: 50S ribosomal protein L9 [Candidatus Micropelagos sp.]|jgi:large subunit ribosomal protein L9|uniref:Large ribosomal subunit protein bL9 n=1 Tax=PS1 clade bacterium TaxID=2175152 RepID=A0A368EHL4_9PROT|nr:50S ribosomal protein L9 [Hyphomicrobiales bacterium]MBL6767012.1 50S ribosomal protein L9 [Candidatus Micropelagos sp.]OUV50109.1 MAG: 50S ribosomal protein L9 [Alphaproteobacteria bacterium TMED110]RCL82995.1 MAG: 50S ribosomal protein L9 [PS1 clade bacterium]HCN31663.1 50S ribosomal protein L9 [Rhodobiaceae bacterium]
MQVVLLERITKLGQMGDVVTVKDGYARNFLLPQGKALRANKSNLERFESERAQLEARNLEQKSEAESVKAKLDGETVIIIRQSGETGQLYGSVSPRDIAEALTDKGFNLERGQIGLDAPIKILGLHETNVTLHPEVSSTVVVNVARTEEEAERQSKGEDVTIEKIEEEEIMLQAEEVFEEGAESDLSEEAEGEETQEAEDVPEASSDEEETPEEAEDSTE